METTTGRINFSNDEKIADKVTWKDKEYEYISRA